MKINIFDFAGLLSGFFKRNEKQSSKHIERSENATRKQLNDEQIDVSQYKTVHAAADDKK